MHVSVTADTTATAHNDDRYDHQKTEYADAQPQGQPESEGTEVRIEMLLAKRPCVVVL